MRSYNEEKKEVEKRKIVQYKQTKDKESIKGRKNP